MRTFHQCFMYDQRCRSSIITAGSIRVLSPDISNILQDIYNAAWLLTVQQNNRNHLSSTVFQLVHQLHFSESMTRELPCAATTVLIILVSVSCNDAFSSVVHGEEMTGCSDWLRSRYVCLIHNNGVLLSGMSRNLSYRSQAPNTLDPKIPIIQLNSVFH